MRGLAFVAVFLVAGCASQVLQSYVGKSITEPILDYGPPSNIVELSDGKRAYQWARTNTGVIPVTTPTTTNVYGSGGFATAYSTTTNYVPYSNDCVYTLIAIKSGDDWIVESFRQPTFSCE